MCSNSVRISSEAGSVHCIPVHKERPRRGGLDGERHPGATAGEAVDEPRESHRESVNQLLPSQCPILLEKLAFLSMGPSSAFG
jgi:hypothetical protein